MTNRNITNASFSARCGRRPSFQRVLGWVAGHRVEHEVSHRRVLRWSAVAIAVLLSLSYVLGAATAQSVAPTPSDTAPVTVAVTGDVFKPDAKSVSDRILAHASVSAVLIAGDTANAKTTPLSSYQEAYQGTYDRFLSKIYPCPGNHDSLSTPPFSGYCEFWGAAAHGPKMYYSFDLGGWHLVSLDSVTFAQGGEEAAAQLDWLKADLAAHAQKPVFAYWHYPLFSRARHGGLAKMKPFWDALYAHGPAIVLNGHNHVYERYSPLDPDGKSVAETKGIQEFLVSPGGASPTKNESPDKLKGPPSAKFHGNAQHVGFFTLYADGGYSYTIDAVARGGTSTLVDTGAGNLLGGPTPQGKDAPTTSSHAMAMVFAIDVAAGGSSKGEEPLGPAESAKARIARARRAEPAKTPDWVNRIPDRIGDITIAKNYYKEGEVWGLAKRGCYGDLPYEEIGSAFFYRTVEEFNLWDRLPKLDAAAKEKALHFWQSWQDPQTGAFKDPRDPKREVNEKFVFILLEAFGGKPRYPIGRAGVSATKGAGGRIDPTLFLQRTLDDPNWAEGGWSVGSHTGGMAVQLFDAISNGQTDLIPALEKGMEQILAHQNPATGLWGPTSASLPGQLGGALKVVNRFYFRMGMKVPYSTQLADSLIAHERNGDWYRDGEDACVPHNVVTLVAYCLEAADYRRDDLFGVLESKVKEYQDWVNPDGSMLLRRGAREDVGFEATHLTALKYIALYLHWADCRLLKPDYIGLYPDFAENSYRPVLQPDGKVRVVRQSPLKKTGEDAKK